MHADECRVSQGLRMLAFTLVLAAVSFARPLYILAADANDCLVWSCDPNLVPYSTEGGPLFKIRNGKVVVDTRGPVGIAVVVISQDDCIRNFPLKDLEAPFSHLPLWFNVIVHNIAQV